MHNWLNLYAEQIRRQEFADEALREQIIAQMLGERRASRHPLYALGKTLSGAGERLQARFRSHAGWAGVEGLHVTFSVGVAQCRFDDTPMRLMERADAALYRAKGEGRDMIRYEFNPPEARL